MAQFAHRDAVEVRYHSFELRPDAPRDAGNLKDLYRKRFGMNDEQAQARRSQMAELAAQEGLVFRQDIARSGNTFDAHRLLQLAADRGLEEAANERFFAAYFSEGQPIGDPETLVKLASEAGLDAEAAQSVLNGDDYADKVRADEKEAAELGISGVPFFVLDYRYGVSGAQPPEVLLQALERTWEDTHPAGVEQLSGDDAGACTDENCAI